MASKMRIIALPGDLAACGHYRVFWPLEAMERAGLAEIHRPEPTESKTGRQQVFIKPEILKDFDIAIFQRQPEERITRLFEIAQGFGVKVVFDIDDDLYSVPPDSPAYLAWGRDWRKIGAKARVVGGIGKLGDPSRSNGQASEKDEYDFLVRSAKDWTNKARDNFAGFIRNLRAADLVTVSTEKLKQVYSKHRNDIVVLKNQMVADGWRDAVASPHQKPDGELWIGWQGSKTHWADLKEIVQPVCRILNENQNARLVLMGFPEARKLFESVLSQVVTFDWMPIDEYRSIAAAFDITLAPVKAITFNQGKSAIRVLESALCGIPVVASETCYGDTVRAAGCGFIAKTSQKWTKHLRRLVNSESLRRELGQNGQEYVDQHRTYDTNAHKWHEAYSNLLNGGKRNECKTDTSKAVVHQQNSTIQRSGGRRRRRSRVRIQGVHA